MIWSDGRALPCVLRQGATVGGLAALVASWWLFIVVALVQTIPAPVVFEGKVEVDLAPGQTARVFLPGMAWLPIPTERAAFDEFQRGVRESDEDAIDHAFVISEWIRVSHHDAIRVITVDGEAVRIELLEGGDSGRQGWLRPRQLVP
jgi:hypothetical protein